MSDIEELYQAQRELAEQQQLEEEQQQWWAEEDESCQ